MLNTSRTTLVVIIDIRDIFKEMNKSFQASKLIKRCILSILFSSVGWKYILIGEKDVNNRAVCHIYLLRYRSNIYSGWLDMNDDK